MVQEHQKTFQLLIVTQFGVAKAGSKHTHHHKIKIQHNAAKPKKNKIVDRKLKKLRGTRQDVQIEQFSLNLKEQL